jgi:hypothetical protein
MILHLDVEVVRMCLIFMDHILINIIILNILLIHFLVVNTTFYFSKVVLNEVVEVVEMFIFPTCVA